MANFIDWYSIELDSLLRGRMPDVLRFEAVKEVTNHLSEHVDELVEKGMNENQAQKAALASFGSPREASMNLLNQGPRSNFGGYLSTMGAIFIFAAMIATTFYIQMQILHLEPGMLFDRPVRYWIIGGSLLIASVIFGIAGAYLSRKVAVKKYLFAFGIGVLVAGGYLIAGPERQFADVPRSQFAAALDQWKSENEDTKKLARLENSIRENLVERYSSDTNGVLPVDQVKALEKILSVGPQMLKVNPRLVQLVGTETAGYLAPAQFNDSDDFYLGAGRRRYHSGYSLAERFANNQANGYPTMQLSMRYMKSKDEAIRAWTTVSGPYSSVNESAFRWIAVQQHDFLNNAETYAKQSRSEVAISFLGPVAGGTLGYVIFILLASWIITKIPNMTLRSTFKRVIA